MHQIKKLTTHLLLQIFLTRNFTFQNNNYSLFPVYGQSKLANILFAKELQRRLDSVHSPILSTVLHPGNVQSDVTRNMPAILRIGHQIFAPLLLLFQKLPRHGAYTTVHVATSPTITKKNGGFQLLTVMSFYMQKDWQLDIIYRFKSLNQTWILWLFKVLNHIH